MASHLLDPPAHIHNYAYLYDSLGAVETEMVLIVLRTLDFTDPRNMRPEECTQGEVLFRPGIAVSHL